APRRVRPAPAHPPRAPIVSRESPVRHQRQQVLAFVTLDQGRGLVELRGPDTERRTVARERARAARGFARVADPPSVPDHPLREHRPVLAREQLADRVLDLDRVLLRGPAPAADEAPEVRVDRDAGKTEGLAEHDVGRLPADAGQLDELVERVRYL